jgi:hypothetical protein
MSAGHLVPTVPCGETIVAACAHGGRAFFATQTRVYRLVYETEFANSPVRLEPVMFVEPREAGAEYAWWPMVDGQQCQHKATTAIDPAVHGGAFLQCNDCLSKKYRIQP